MFVLKILRGIPSRQYWEEFELKRRPLLNVIAALMEIRSKPINRAGKLVKPVVWEDGCLEEVCGACSMLINGKPRQACSSLVENLLAESQQETIVLEPLSKFPLVRDLMVDRKVLFEHLKRVKAWTESKQRKGFGPRYSPEKQEVLYSLAKCMVCGNCSEACPKVNASSKFIGPAALTQAQLANSQPAGEKQSANRLQVLKQDEGVRGCANIRSCSKVCPKKIPLPESISILYKSLVK